MMHSWLKRYLEEWDESSFDTKGYIINESKSMCSSIDGMHLQNLINGIKGAKIDHETFTNLERELATLGRMVKVLNEQTNSNKEQVTCALELQQS